jgi:hypothetical protein
MEQIERYRQLAGMRVKQLADEDLTLRRWFRTVRIFGLPLFILSIICPVAAGSVALAELLPLDQRTAVIAALSFVGAATVALHRGLQCETYQAALLRTIQSVRSIMEDFEAVYAAPDNDVPGCLKHAEARLRELRASSKDLPPKRQQSFDNFLNGRG